MRRWFARVGAPPCRHLAATARRGAFAARWGGPLCSPSRAQGVQKVIASVRLHWPHEAAFFCHRVEGRSWQRPMRARSVCAAWCCVGICLPGQRLIN